MKKTTKGALAIGAAAVLLSGGAGTLAYWNASTDIAGSTLKTGELKLGAASCDTDWVYANGAKVNAIVPGDKLTKNCTFVITAKGDNIKADLVTPASVTITGAGASFKATVGAAYTIDGAAAPASITNAQDGKTVTAKLTVDFPFGDTTGINTNNTQGVTAQLQQVAVTLTQKSA